MTAPADWQLGDRLHIGGHWIELMPDTHLGRVFTTDVPLHRRGDREKFVWGDFEQRMMAVQSDTNLHVHLGDLFDTPRVTPATVLRAADIYLNAARRSQQCLFVVMAGNHDIGRDFQKTSFDLFAALVSGQAPNITIVRDKPARMMDMGFFPWVADRRAEELVSGSERLLDAAFGHWDLTGQSDNLIPVEALSARTSLAITGHDHKRRFERRGTLEVIAAGSMQPYAHDEGSMYWSGTLDQLPANTRQLCLRIFLRPGETIPEDLDAFQISSRPIVDVSEEALPEIETLDFNVNGLLAEAFARNGVPKEIISVLNEKRHVISH